MAFHDQLREGMVVRSTDGEKLGKVALLTDADFVIEKGLFFKKDFTCRYDQIADIRGDEVWLSWAGRELETGERASAPMSTATASEELRVPLAEEELEARKVGQQVGEVQVHKDVITERKDISVPVTREEVRVERVPATGEARPGAASFQEGTTTVPVYEEELEVRKRPVVREEVRVAKERFTEERRASEDVRKEIADVDEGSPKRDKY